MHDGTHRISRRALLTGGSAPKHCDSRYCVSSAVVTVLPGREQEVVARLGRMPGVTLHGEGRNKLVLVLEGSDSGVVGSLLAEISVMDGVLAANMVFEQTEPVRGG